MSHCAIEMPGAKSLAHVIGKTRISAHLALPHGTRVGKAYACPYLRGGKVFPLLHEQVVTGACHINGQNIRVSGAHGLAEGVGDEGYTYMGTFIRKYVDYILP